ncbi:MAG: sortase [Patescibacteria group bacterium]|jgi:LPXTG-site transpeptidase (sortase) family protein
MEYYLNHTPVPKPRNRARGFFVEMLKFLGIFVIFFAISTAFIMWPNIYTTVNYWIKSGSWQKEGTNLGLPIASEDYASIAPVIGERNRTIPQDMRLVIPKINVDAPIIMVDSTNNKDILESLSNGVAHYADTALPGRVGNMFITGHSSYYWWRGGNYNHVFALLEQVKTNDLLYVYYEGGEYVYKVNGSKVVTPKEVSVLKQTPTPTMSIMTCVPVGTNLRRLIVTADLISTPPVDVDQLNQFSDIPKVPIILPL